MHSRTKGMKNWPFAVSGLAWRISLTVFGYLMIAPSLAHAHGGMSGSELGPPLVTSGLLGFVCYWLVVLWPSAKKKNGDREVEPSLPNRSVSRTRRHAHQNAARIKLRPRLRKIERSSQVASNVHSGRKATDV